MAAITIALTDQQEAAVLREHGGSLEYLSGYVTRYADHLIGKQAEDDRQAKIRELAALSAPEIDAAYREARSKVIASLSVEEVAAVSAPIIEK